MSTSIDSATELLNALKQAREGFGKLDVWWRGQAKFNWFLQPGIYRRGDADIAEQELVRIFRRKARARYSICPEEQDVQNWLFLMQHHRLETRLLDWSESILVAAYFAVNDEWTEPGALWALSPFLLNENQFGKKIIYSGGSDDVKPLFYRAFNRDFPKVEKVAGIATTESHARMMTQLSVFTIHGNADKLEEIKGNEKYLMKFEIPADSKKTLHQLLYDLGIRESNLFPDLDHLAKELKWPRSDV